jgi:Na+/melibiose symporter-like transporter
VEVEMTNSNADTRPLSTGEFFLTMLVLGLPLIGFILMLVWSFGSGNVNRRNFCRAMLIFTVIVIGLWLISFFSGLALFSSFPELRSTIEGLIGS